MSVQASEIEVKVMGELPSWLNGSLIVNGGGDYSRMNHMFDGYALVSKVRVSGGQAWGSQRFLQSKSFNAYKTEGALLVALGVDCCDKATYSSFQDQLLRRWGRGVLHWLCKCSQQETTYQ